MSNPQTAGSNPEHKLRVVKPPGALRVVFWDDLLSLLQSLFRKVGWSLQIDGAESASAGVDGTLRFKIKPATTSTQGLDVGSDGKVIAATVMGVMPTIGGTRLDAGTPPNLTIPGSGTRYVVITITGTFQITDSIFVKPTFSGDPTVVITLETTAPTYSDTISSSGVFKLLHATFVDGVRTSQNGHGPITCDLCDDNSKTATAILTPTYAGP